MSDPAPYRRYGDYVASECDMWNAGAKPGEDVFGVPTEGTAEDAVMKGVRFALLQFQILDEEQKTIQRLRKTIERKKLDEQQ